MVYPTLTFADIDGALAPIAGIYTITPSFAAAVLKIRNKGNRNIAPTKATQATHDVANGDFVLNGETLIFSNEGNLLDGQHRLTAVVAAGKSITSMVAMGMDPDTAKTVDRGKTRDLGDVLTRLGYPNGKALASIARHMLGYYASNGVGFGRNEAYSDAEIKDYIDASLTIQPITAWAVNLKTHMLGMVTVSQMGIARSILEPKYGQVEVLTFLRQVALGTNIGLTDPAYVVRRRLMSERAAKVNGKLTNIVAVEIVMRGFLNFHAKKPITKLQTCGELPSINKTARAAKTTALGGTSLSDDGALSII